MNRSVRDVRDTLLQSCPLGKCPYCGQGQVTTLDHYLPQTDYPEFSILPLNLIPSCSDCNKRKLDEYRGNNAALFLHAYLDSWPDDTRFLFATIFVVDQDVFADFRVNPPCSLDTSLQGRLVSHFDRLNLREYYGVEAINEISERRTVIEELIRTGVPPVAVSALLRRDAVGVANSQGRNHWKFVLLEALAADDRFCAGSWVA
jgi:hypothetical protein